MPDGRPPWPPGSFDLAREAFSRGEYGPKLTYYITITDSADTPFTSTEKLQKATGPPAIAEARWASKTPREADVETEDMEKVKVCEVNPEQFERVKETARTDQMVIWIDGKKRFAYIVGEPGSRPEMDSEGEIYV